MDEFNLDSIGLELTEMAHGDLDHRGLVLVSDVLVDDKQHHKIQVGDTIVGVFAVSDVGSCITIPFVACDRCPTPCPIP